MGPSKPQELKAKPPATLQSLQQALVKEQGFGAEKLPERKGRPTAAQQEAKTENQRLDEALAKFFEKQRRKK